MNDETLRHPDLNEGHVIQEGDNFAAATVLRQVTPNVPSAMQLVHLARKISLARKFRSQFLAEGILGEPGFDMVLALFIASAEGRRVTVSELALASGTPLTTALRWMSVLKKRQLTSRRRSPLDARVSYIDLEPEGCTQVATFLENAWMSLYR
jgi:DNA-binding MarR family transcriptional regulator